MKKFVALAVFCFIVSVPVFSVAAGTGADAQVNKKDDAAQVDGLAKDIIGLFPRAEGKVADADEKTLTLDIGSESGLKPGMAVTCAITRPSGQVTTHTLLCRIDTQDEADYFLNGGILSYVLRNLAASFVQDHR